MGHYLDKRASDVPSYPSNYQAAQCLVQPWLQYSGQKVLSEAVHIGMPEGNTLLQDRHTSTTVARWTAKWIQPLGPGHQSTAENTKRYFLIWRTCHLQRFPSPKWMWQRGPGTEANQSRPGRAGSEEKRCHIVNRPNKKSNRCRGIQTIPQNKPDATCGQSTRVSRCHPALDKVNADYWGLLLAPGGFLQFLRRLLFILRGLKFILWGGCW